MATNDVYRCQLEARTHGVNWSLSFHVRDDGGMAEGEGANLVAEACNTDLSGAFVNCVSDDTQFQAWYALREETPENPGLMQLVDNIGTITGTDSYPANSCLVFSFRGEDANLKRAGRFYLSGIPKDKVNGGVVDATYLAGPIKTLTDLLEAPITGGGVNLMPGVYRTVDNGVPIVGGLFVEHDEVIVEPQLYTQRPRTSQSRGISA